MEDAGFMSNYSGTIASLIDTYMDQRNAQRNQEYMNEYNSPKNQVARLRAAGLSPWSVNPNGNMSAQPVFNPGHLAENVNRAFENSMARRQLEIQDKVAGSQASVNESLAETNRTLLRYLDRDQEATIRQKNAAAAVNERQASRYDEEVTQNIKTQQSQEYLNYIQSDRVDADIDRIYSLLPGEVQKQKEDIKLTRANVAYLKTQCSLNNKQISLLVEQIDKTKKEAEKIGAEAWMQKHKNTITDKMGVIPGTPAWTALSDFLFNHLNNAASVRSRERFINKLGTGEPYGE